MSKCSNCGVRIMDRTERCPLCQHVLEQGGLEGRMTYPDVRVATRRFRFLVNLVLFLSIVAESVLICVNLMVEHRMLWCVTVGLVLVYVNLALRFAFLGRSGYPFKLSFLIAAAVLFLLGIDYQTGYRGWSVNYVFPAGILLMDLLILILMMANHRNWQSYMMYQLFTILLGIGAVLLYAGGIAEVLCMELIALAASVFLFLGTLILGDRRARTELKRRFYL